MQPNRDRDDVELLALADATERVAASVAEAAIQARLREIANEVRMLARRDGKLASVHCQRA